ncbi:methyl-accepting chemotaxis protein [Massilia pinisoli]|uniref:Methyl-accepting chemotaxis protein n=1 Tax=Massilia pinisoli TaxID=1772194 RepID=A0ABT1ZUY5_9BURK|nr:methyl-accepting chemotaxis protein [Massilia pinisoli]MCS0583753.1 methyl-accepting chemotaxis protein [Massilia pinisoli]
MRLAHLQTGTKILGAFAVVSLAIVIISIVALWRMQAADAITNDLVNDKLARQQLTAELQGIARLNGVRAVAIARSDSLEAGDYFQAQLTQGDKNAAALDAKLAALPSAPAERALIDAAAQRKAAYLKIRAQVFQAKDLGKTQDVEQMTAGELATTFDVYTHALDSLLAWQTREARALAATSAHAFALSRVLLPAFGAAALLIGCAAGWLLTRSIVTPLQHAVELAERVAEGDLSATIDHARGDEIGRLFDALNHMTGGVSATVVKVLDSARTIDDASAEIAAGNRDLSHRTEEQARNLHATVQAMSELTEAVEQNHVNAHDANALALAASGVAQQGAGAVGQMVERMETIRQSAARIGDITAMIDGIAFQTNILALNAAVEAARAGAEGRGFAVVAAEVRSLAQHSAAAAKEIKQLIGESTGAIESGAGIASAAGGTMREILARVREVADLLHAIDGASSEQAAGIAQVRRVIADMDEATQQNAAMVEQAAAAAATLRAQAEQLTDVVSTFRVQGDDAGRPVFVAECENEEGLALPAPAWA